MCRRGRVYQPRVERAIQQGDHLIVDVEASTLPPQPDAYVPPDSTFAEVDGSTLYGPGYDASALLVVCSPPDGSASADDAGAGGDAASACQPLPAACAGQQPPCASASSGSRVHHDAAPPAATSIPTASVGNGFNLFPCPP